MNNKEKTYSEELQRCRDNIANTKRLIEYHKDMLKKMERKEAEILAKLNDIKLLDLRELMSKDGYNIDDLREAIKAGNFSGIVPKNTEPPAENALEKQAKAESSADENETSDTDEENLNIERKDEK
ncbi:MAG: hypothetical protein J1F04_09265 [Oscillospiraceae bacterium]|nr:hypothetical protein [Oscillospiraceae bacterium]